MFIGLGTSIPAIAVLQRAGGPPPPPEPSTQDYSFAEVGQGLTGMLDPTSAAGKVKMYAAQAVNPGGFWAAQITGTDASILLYQNTSDQPAGMVEVSVDGGAWASASISGGKYVLFADLEQAVHTVVVRINVIYGGSANMPSSGAVLTVTGVPPSVEAFSNWVQPGDGNSKAVCSNALEANAPGGSFVPASVINGSSDCYQNTASVAVRGAFTKLAVLNRARYIFVSIDGSAPNVYDAGSNKDWLKVIDGLSGTHTYYVWSSFASGRQMSVGGIASGGLANIASKRCLDQFGDSITAGDGASSTAATDTFPVASALGMVGSNFGVGGNTIALLLARIPTILAARTVTSNDVAVIAVGRNDAGGAFDGTKTANYQAIVQACLDAGYGKVICRGILPENDTWGKWTAENGSIASIASGFADARVKFCDTSTWMGFATADGTHPTDAGYVTITGYAVPAYTALLA